MERNTIASPALSVFLLLILFINIHTSAQQLCIDNTHSSIEFSVRFMGVSDVTGKFEKFCGYMAIGEKDVVPSEMILFIDARSINSGLKMRDRDLMNEYLDCDQYPIIAFRSRKIYAPTRGRLSVEGDLILHGKTHPVKLKVSVLADITNGDGGRELGLKVSPLKINRKDFDVIENSTGISDSIETEAAIRLRDVRPYRKEFDASWPELKDYHGNFVTGRFADPSTTIRLIQYDNRYFLAFDDNDWGWFSELKPTGNTTFKTTSFNALLTLSPDYVVLEKDEKKLVLSNVDGK